MSSITESVYVETDAKKAGLTLAQLTSFVEQATAAQRRTGGWVTVKGRTTMGGVLYRLEALTTGAERPSTPPGAIDVRVDLNEGRRLDDSTEWDQDARA